VISLWLELLGIVTLFYYLLTIFGTGKKGMPFLIDPVFLIAGLYLVVFAGVMIKLIRIAYAMQREKRTLENFKLEAEKRLNEPADTAILTTSLSDSARSCLTIRSDRKEILIPTTDILYIQAMGDYVIVFRESGEKHMTIETLIRILQKLPDNEFMRIHRSYIVNKQKISAIGSNSLEIADVTLPISRNYRSIKNGMQISC
jgi:DNA-binding LytR/AlgR family response regulator